ncbi:hypothetical protein PsorP6_016388 [Peronosclerospora sorghi]|uniref:Uncharacterized protein n=1 Tax=Peronosclerospora sorghi TaxID=230839 RepID=A0ACC0VQL0_9STRA|nr:hypothetical protein PsorP6_016388 [Peronosclerospora sorghi]
MEANTESTSGDAHSTGGDIDSLLSNEPSVRKDTVRCLHEPYDRHRAHDLRAECYRRGIRPIKKGPNANDNKNGYIQLLRQNDGSISKPPGARRDGDDMSTGGNNASEIQIITNLTTKRTPLPTMTMQAQTKTEPNNLVATSAAVADLQGFYEGGQPNLVQYAQNVPKPVANLTTDLEILSGIANSYTQNLAADGQFCSNCRTVVTDQLMESIRLGKTKMQLQEWHRMTEQRDRDTLHLKQVLEILQDLRKAYREAQVHGMNHETLIDLQSDMAFFQNLKEQTKERMHHAMREARKRSTPKSDPSA